MCKNKTSPAISVIVPVYNEEKFIRNCLNSIVNQTMKDFEVIIVNDGSTDFSSNIIEEFKKENSNFIIINQENLGVAEARNQALKYARGDDLAFVDSDDHIEPEFLEKLYLTALSTNADIVCCGFSTYLPEKDKKIRKPFCFKTGVYSNKKMLNSLIKDIRMHFYMWNKLWKKDLFIKNNISFPDMYFEDIPVVMSLFYFANKIAVINKEYYNYTKSDYSIVNNIDEEKLNDYIRSFACMRNFLEKNKDYNNYKLSYLLYGYRTMLINLKLIYKICAQKKDIKGLFKKIRSLNSKVIYCMKDEFACFDNISEFPDSIN